MASTDDDITFERIRERAYELWERNHRPEGLEIQFWLAAERELRTEAEAHRKAPTLSEGYFGGDEGTPS